MAIVNLSQNQRITSYLKLDELSDAGKNLSLKYLLFSILTMVFNFISSTIIILYVIDLVGYPGLSLLLAINFIVAAVTDYPTGVLADYIGHKWVLTIAYVFFAISSFMLAFSSLVPDPFVFLVITYIVLAIANGQASGALQSWYDNKYKIHCSEEDPKKEIYREFLGKASMFTQYSGSLAFLLGGLLASLFPGTQGRVFVFVLQGIGQVVLVFLFVFFLESGEEQPDEKKESEDSYFALLTSGIKFSFSSPTISLYILSSVILIAVSLAWYNLVLFVIYFGYTASDAGAGALRWSIWFIGAMLMSRAGKISKKLTEKPWMPILSAGFILIFFGLAAVTVWINPIPNPPDVNIVGIIAILVVFIVGGFVLNIYNLLSRKLLLDVVPDELRNSVYSLLPTLGLLVGSGLLLVIGNIIETSGFLIGILLIIGISLLGSLLEFFALRNYEPPETSEELDDIHDIYSLANFDAFMFKIPKKWHFAPRVKIIWDQLLEIAEEDGQIDESEKGLLDYIMTHFTEYGSILEKALHDEIITEEEKIQLLTSRHKLIQDAEAIAAEDKVITEEEAKILDKLKTIVHELHIEHH